MDELFPGVPLLSPIRHSPRSESSKLSTNKLANLSTTEAAHSSLKTIKHLKIRLKHCRKDESDALVAAGVGKGVATEDHDKPTQRKLDQKEKEKGKQKASRKESPSHSSTMAASSPKKLKIKLALTSNSTAETQSAPPSKPAKIAPDSPHSIAAALKTVKVVENGHTSSSSTPPTNARKFKRTGHCSACFEKSALVVLDCSTCPCAFHLDCVQEAFSQIPAVHASPSTLSLSPRPIRNSKSDNLWQCNKCRNVIIIDGDLESPKTIVGDGLKSLTIHIQRTNPKEFALPRDLFSVKSVRENNPSLANMDNTSNNSIRLNHNPRPKNSGRSDTLQNRSESEETPPLNTNPDFETPSDNLTKLPQPQPQPTTQVPRGRGRPKRSSQAVVGGGTYTAHPCDEFLEPLAKKSKKATNTTDTESNQQTNHNPKRQNASAAAAAAVAEENKKEMAKADELQITDEFTPLPGTMLVNTQYRITESKIKRDFFARLHFIKSRRFGDHV